jgi:hypothetical protein
MDYAPIARIIARYVIGTVAGAAVSDAVLNDPDLMNMLTMGISAVGAYAVEKIYAIAKSRGWAT